MASTTSEDYDDRRQGIDRREVGDRRRDRRVHKDGTKVPDRREDDRRTR
jgi:hypothetical protein